MTKRDFEKQYAKNSGISVEEFHQLGLFAEECDCGDDDCLGWQMEKSKEKIYSVKSGNWDNPEVWNVKRVPTDKDCPEVRHKILVKTPELYIDGKQFIVSYGG